MCPCVQIKSAQRVGPRLSGDKLYPSCPSPQSFFWNLQNSNRNVTSHNQGTFSGEEERGTRECSCLERSELVTPYPWIQRNWQTQHVHFYVILLAATTVAHRCHPKISLLTNFIWLYFFYPMIFLFLDNLLHTFFNYPEIVLFISRLISL